jgi:hypothetical protein
METSMSQVVSRVNLLKLGGASLFLAGCGAGGAVMPHLQARTKGMLVRIPLSGHSYGDLAVSVSPADDSISLLSKGRDTGIALRRETAGGFGVRGQGQTTHMSPVAVRRILSAEAAAMPVLVAPGSSPIYTYDGGKTFITQQNGYRIRLPRNLGRAARWHSP